LREKKMYSHRAANQNAVRFIHQRFGAPDFIGNFAPPMMTRKAPRLNEFLRAIFNSFSIKNPWLLLDKFVIPQWTRAAVRRAERSFT